MNKLPNQKFTFESGMKWAPAAGGVNTEWDKAQLGLGEYSNAENVRLQGPGFKLRPGLIRNHTTSLGFVYSLYSYKNGDHFFAQLDDGDVYDATNLPPAAGSGTFGGDPVLDESALNVNGTGTIVPGSWSTIRDNLLFSQGKMQHTVRTDDDAKPLLVTFVKGTTAPRIIDEETADITDDVTDPGSSKVSDTLTFTVANEDSLYICTEYRAENFIFDLQTIPGGTKTLEFSYFNGDDWTVQSGGTYSDGTLAWAQDGTIFAPIDERSTTEYPTVMFGQSGYWYRFELGSTTAEPTISFNTISYNGPFQLLENVMSPLPEFVIEAQVETAAGEYETYAASSVIVGGLAAGDYIYFSTTDPAWAIYADVGSTPNTTAGLAIDDIQVWTGAWTSVGTVEDLTNGLTNTGYISWDRTAVTPRKRSFNGSQYRAYWYAIKFDDALSADVVLSLSTLPYYDIAALGQVGEVSTAWKQRGCFTFSKFPRDIYVSEKDRPNILNGDDYAILIPGDGRYHRVTAMLSFYNELMAFQAEEGKDGGCITLFEGYSPETFGKLVLSTRLGTFSQASVCIVDGSSSVTKTTNVIETQVAFISKYGIFITDGQQIRDLSEPIRNYFDPENDEYIDVSGHHWIEYDRQANGLRVGLTTIEATGDPVRPNVFLFFHLDNLEWTFDTYSDALPTAFCEVTANSGDVDSLQYLAAQSAGDGAELIYQCDPKIDYDEEPDGTEVAVVGKLRMEFSGGGHYLEIRELTARFTSDDDYTLTKRVYENGVLDSDETETFSMADENSGSFYRERILEMVKLNHQFSLELEWENTEEDWGISPRIYDFNYEIHTNPGVA